MKYEYSENVLVQDSAAALMHDELGWDVVFAYNRMSSLPIIRRCWVRMVLSAGRTIMR